MMVFHAAASREFHLAPAAVRRVKPGDRKHAQDVDTYLNSMCYSLHEHHHGEDAILWPILRPRLSAAERRLLDANERQHADINDGIEKVNDARRQWLDRLDQEHGSVLANKLKTLSGLVDRHLEDEERDILPMAAAYLTQAEWRTITEGGKNALSVNALLFVVGMTCYGVSREHAALVVAPLSAPLRRVVLSISHRMYVRRAARIHGSTNL
jgi:hemerythrin-like domain-containing protein